MDACNMEASVNEKDIHPQQTIWCHGVEEQNGCWNISQYLQRIDTERRCIKEFSSWFYENEKRKEREGIVRRRKMDRRLRSLRPNSMLVRMLVFLLILIWVSGIVITFCSTVRPIGEGTLMYTYKEIYRIVGLVLLGVGVILLMIVEVIRDKKKEKRLKEVNLEFVAVTATVCSNQAVENHDKIVSESACIYSKGVSTKHAGATSIQDQKSFAKKGQRNSIINKDTICRHVSESGQRKIAVWKKNKFVHIPKGVIINDVSYGEETGQSMRPPSSGHRLQFACAAKRQQFSHRTVSIIIQEEIRSKYVESSVLSGFSNPSEARPLL